MIGEVKKNLPDLMHEAGSRLSNEFSRGKKVLSREKHDIKLELDQQTEIFLKNKLSRLFPDTRFIAEEMDSLQVEEEGQYYWIIDPIDGTSNYAAGIPHFCISVALKKDGTTILGAIYDPIRKEFFWAEKGKGTWLNGRRLKLEEKNYEESFCVMGLYKTEDTIDKGMALLQKVVHNFSKIRITGAAALDLAWLASGRFQVFFEYGLHLWDIAAGELIVREAGGKVRIEPYQSGTFFILAGLPAYCDLIFEKKKSMIGEEVHNTPK